MNILYETADFFFTLYTFLITLVFGYTILLANLD